MPTDAEKAVLQFAEAGNLFAQQMFDAGKEEMRKEILTLLRSKIRDHKFFSNELNHLFALDYLHNAIESLGKEK